MTEKNTEKQAIVYPETWTELLAQLGAQYRHCKKNKLSADNEEWSEWSGEFNRHCNKKDVGKGYGGFSRITRIWTTYTRLLALYKLLSTASSEAGKSGRSAIKKIIMQNIKVLAGQKKEFKGSLL